MICLKLREPDGTCRGPGPFLGLVGAGVPDAGFSAVVLWNKTGTAAEAVLYVDNRGSPGSRQRQAYRVNSRWSREVPRKSQDNTLRSSQRAERRCLGTSRDR